MKSDKLRSVRVSKHGKIYYQAKRVSNTCKLEKKEIVLYVQREVAKCTLAIQKRLNISLSEVWDIVKREAKIREYKIENYP